MATPMYISHLLHYAFGLQSLHVHHNVMSITIGVQIAVIISKSHIYYSFLLDYKDSDKHLDGQTSKRLIYLIGSNPFHSFNTPA